MKRLAGVCSLIENVSQSSYHKLFKGSCVCDKEPLVIYSEDAKTSDREGCFICLMGQVENIKELKEEYKIKDKSEVNVLLSLYLLTGKSFAAELEGSFVIIICDELKRQVHIFTDKNNKNAVYFAGIDGAFLFSNSIGDILSCPGFTPVINTTGILRLFALPCAYLGEPVCDIYRVLGNEYATVSVRGAEIYSYRRKIISKLPDKMDIAMPACGDLFLYYMIKEGNIKSAVPPHVVASAINNKAFTDGHLMLLQSCEPYEDLMKEKYDFKGFVSEYTNNLLCDLDYFNFEKEEDIERVEAFYLYYKLFLQNTSLEISKICSFYGIENRAAFLNPDILAALFNEKREKMLYSSSGNLYLTQDIRKITAELCKNADEPVFDIVSRHRLYSATEEVEESYLLFILRLNRFLKHFKPYLEL